MNRRDSLQKIVLGSTVLFIAPSLLQSCSKDDANDPSNVPSPPAPGQNITIDLSSPDNNVLNSTGGSKIVQSILVANTGSGYIALSSVCTHQGCTVAYNGSTVQCPCHGSEFGTTGSVLQGPANRPLKSYTVTKAANILTIVT
ncbi:MAG TPA: Rieske (2Fe-2S) protein [Bacteroidales bacterium]|nr:Rieske (2Fe-2S) protein [Bacteroidales bacterium]